METLIGCSFRCYRPSEDTQSGNRPICPARNPGRAVASRPTHPVMSTSSPVGGSDRREYRNRMEAFAAAVVAIAIILGALLLVAFLVYCLVHIFTTERVPLLPRWLWAVAVVFVSPLGGLVYLLSQYLFTGSVRRRLAPGAVR